MLADGITMGGGIGLAGHAAIRIVTERSKLAMPETRIGFTPDVGGTWLLARAPGRLGEYLALTGASMDASDAIYAGFADHFVPSANLDGLRDALETRADPSSPTELVLLFDETPEPSPARGRSARGSTTPSPADTVAEIVERLRARPEAEASATADLLGELSPTGLAVTLAAVRRARELPDLRAALAQEYGLVMWFATTQPDLLEGIRAQLVDKDRTPALAARDDRRADAGCRGIRFRVPTDDSALELKRRTMTRRAARAPLFDRDRDRLVLLRLRRPRRGLAGLPELHRDVPASAGGASSFALAFWVLLAYLVLPRLHRILTTIYVPDYFIGRARTSDGLLGDPVNLAFLGEAEQIHAAMAAAGWTRADPVTLGSSWRIVTSTLTRRSYGEAPVSPLFLFGRQQDFAYQQEVDGNPAQRHHVRFWRCPDGWLLPGGYRVDWLAAGTFDTAVGLSLFTLQVTHRIDADTDIERDHIVATRDRRRPAGRGRRSSRTSRRATTPATAAATASAPTATCRSSTCASRLPVVDAMTRRTRQATGVRAGRAAARSRRRTTPTCSGRPRPSRAPCWCCCASSPA